MTRRERVQRVLQHEEVDRLPTQANFTKVMRKKIADHLSISETEVDNRFDNHLLRVDLTYQKGMFKEQSSAADWWGVAFDTREEGYFIKNHPMTDTKDLSDFPWPDPDKPGLLREAEAAVKRADATGGESRPFIIPNLGFALFERAWSLRGMEQFMMDLALDEVWCEELLERITRIQVRLAERYVEAGVDGGYFGDDLGAQKGLLFSPEVWRRLFKPRLKRMFRVFTDAGLPVIMHSDGDIGEIIPDLIDIGLSCLNPCQPEVLDHGKLKKEFGSRLSFYGGLSTQGILPRGKPEEVRAAAAECIAELGSDGTGFIFGPSHRMMSDIPMENIVELLHSLSYCKL